MRGERDPVLCGVAQRSVRPGEPGVGALGLEGACDPMALLDEVARGAARDAGIGEGALREVDTIGLVDALGWYPRNGPNLLAERLGARPRRELATGIGGESALLLVNHAARAVARGESELALLAGVHVVKTLRRARAEKVALALPVGGEGSPVRISESRAGNSEREGLYGLSLPVTVYPLFENALRARRGLDLEEHRARMGTLFEPFTRVAAANPHAWFRTVRSADELTKVTERNRMIAFPYPKYLNAVMETDQAACVLLGSAAAARRLGVAEDRLAFWWGGGDAVEEPWFATERPDFVRSPALRAAAAAALAEAGIGVDDLHHLDFYSCFPAAVAMACEMLGVAEDDARGLTVTGGLPYFGGPGNDYCTHALATMVERLRARGGAGLVTGNGWYFTKHAATVVGARPREREPRPAPPPAARGAAVAFADEADGEATLETYTVVYDRAGAPERGIAVGRLDDGLRFLADVLGDRDALEGFVAREEAGRRGRVRHREGRNRFEPR